VIGLVTASSTTRDFERQQMFASACMSTPNGATGVEN